MRNVKRAIMVGKRVLTTKQMVVPGLAFVAVTACWLSSAAGQGPMTPVNEPRKNPVVEPAAPAAPAVPVAPATPAPKAVPAPAAEPAPAPVAAEANVTLYPVSKFDLSYGVEVKNVPSPTELTNTTRVRLGKNGNVYTSPSAGIPTVEINLGSLTDTVNNYDALAIREVSRAVANNLRNRGLLAVLVGPPSDEIDQAGGDRREGRTTFKLSIIVGKVGDIRTLANGDRIDEPRINNPAHDSIRENSPIQKGGFLERDALEDYGYRLNRHPGRRVDVSVAPGSDTPGDISLDFLVNENKPWYILAQLSNTGTKNTEKWRERFAFVHNQFSGNDDILRLDYVTAGFASAHSFLGEYEFPLLTDKLRVTITGGYNKYTASDVGLANESFKGNGWRFGGELAYNILQYQQLFVDVLGGVRYEHVETRNDTSQVSGATNLFLPYAGLRIDRNTDTSQLNAKVVFEWTQSDVADTKEQELASLGRIDPALNWTVIKWDVGYSFYLEPILFPEKYAGGYQPVGPDGKPALWEPGMSLAHEIALSIRGQNSLNRRLIPNAEEVVGGFFSVRGYPESAVAGDNAIIGSAEYRLHIPRLFGISSETGKDIFGKDFRWQPSEPFGYADWDLIFRGFFDVGRSTINDIRSFERNETLAGAGAGLELQLRRNIFIRADWGVALRGLPQANVKSGDSRLHFLVSILF